MEDGTIERTTQGTPQGGVISPLLANIYLHVLDERWTREHSHLGELVRYADDFVVMCDSASACEEAERRIGEILAELGLELYAEKTRRAELTWGQDGFVFLGCYLRKRLSGRMLERYGKRRYYLHRCPAPRAMKRVRGRVRGWTSQKRCGVRDVRVIIRHLNLFLRGWGNYFRTGNAAQKFVQVDDYVVWRLRRFMQKGKGRNLRAGESRRWNRAFFEGHGLYRLRGTIRYPEAA